MRSPPEISAYAPSAALIFIPPIFQYFLHIQKMYNVVCSILRSVSFTVVHPLLFFPNY